MREQECSVCILTVELVLHAHREGRLEANGGERQEGHEVARRGRRRAAAPRLARRLAVGGRLLHSTDENPIGSYSVTILMQYYYYYPLYSGFIAWASVSVMFFKKYY